MNDVELEEGLMNDLENFNVPSGRETIESSQNPRIVPSEIYLPENDKATTADTLASSFMENNDLKNVENTLTEPKTLRDSSILRIGTNSYNFEHFYILVACFIGVALLFSFIKWLFSTKKKHYKSILNKNKEAEHVDEE